MRISLTPLALTFSFSFSWGNQKRRSWDFGCPRRVAHIHRLGNQHSAWWGVQPLDNGGEDGPAKWLETFWPPWEMWLPPPPRPAATTTMAIPLNTTTWPPQHPTLLPRRSRTTPMVHRGQPPLLLLLLLLWDILLPCGARRPRDGVPPRDRNNLVKRNLLSIPWSHPWEEILRRP